MPLSNLNDEQRLAATAKMGHNLIIASAGTGKTSTIVGRIAHLFDNQILPESILLLTFTNKAAEEMIARVAKKFGQTKARAIQSGTFHAIAYRYLKEKRNITLKQPRELKILFKSIAEKRVYPSFEGTTPYSAQYLYDLYSLFLNTSKDLDFPSWLREKNPAQEQFALIYEGIFEEFDALKKTFHYADYNDLLLLYREEIQKNPIPYAEVLCDEYQDTNPLQDSLLDALNPQSLFCVGDYDQSIYAFNGADISIIANFTRKYPDAQVFTLSKNYRSSSLILDLANRVIQKNPRIYPKRLEVIKSGDFPPPRLLVYEELFLQYQEIARRIASGNPNFDEVAIIFRNNASADGCEASLRELGVPTKRKGSTSFFDTKEVALMLDLCALLYNPKDMMAFIHTLSYGPQIGSSVAKDIYEAFINLGDGDVALGILSPNAKKPYQTRAKNAQLGLFDDLFLLENAARFDGYLAPTFCSHPILSHPKFTRDSALFLQDFCQLFTNLHKEKNPHILIDAIAKNRFYGRITEMLARERAKNKDGSIDPTRKSDALEKIARKVLLLQNLAKHYDSLGKFLNAMILGASEAVQGSGVNLLSIHASKGLEYEEVYVIDLMEGRFPNTKLIQKGGSLEEERRLFYVAVTRAKTRLYLSYAKSDPMKNLQYQPSVFLLEAGMISKMSL
ncbi:ATP-dependent helicase [Helicobacter mustelae]|uniref:DNA 3'-5' helicase n=1 Tax=Helicobacter mustelae (strain ATCC 43772 / CCUG 25715 / CIP 103759 / LMG 18044 / NCTC 12198 / R85-136P) TaxID=679897 RepID=D3UHW2_HELM1|nr:ATP-dependent helicase [Helicobacter mustelae]CBG40085.1 putative ATP-dependent DNA helicase [Helicobacter mustelae 12198]SQH71599.1 ATP-dependent DNA helicase [Helicobacter mustelae]